MVSRETDDSPYAKLEEVKQAVTDTLFPPVFEMNVVHDPGGDSWAYTPPCC